MTKQKPLYLFHLLALCIVCVWGTTFVSTQTLISNGLMPTEIFIYRFALAYICVLFMAPRRLFADTFADEMRMIAAGLTGGSVYFITENTALGMMQAPMWQSLSVSRRCLPRLWEWRCSVRNAQSVRNA